MEALNFDDVGAFAEELWELFIVLRTEILEQELLLLICNDGGAPFLWKAIWKYPGMVVEAGCFVSYWSLCKGYGISKSGHW